MRRDSLCHKQLARIRLCRSNLFRMSYFSHSKVPCEPTSRFYAYSWPTASARHFQKLSPQYIHTVAIRCLPVFPSGQKTFHKLKIGLGIESNRSFFTVNFVRYRRVVVKNYGIHGPLFFPLAILSSVEETELFRRGSSEQHNSR